MGFSITRAKDELLSSCKSFLNELKVVEGDALVVYRNSVDGVCAASIILKLLEDLGKSYSILSLEAPYPEVLEALLSPRRHDYLIFLDLGSSSILKHDWEVPIFVIDDHRVLGGGREDFKEINVLNPSLYDLPGKEAACSSSLAYLVGRNLNPQFKRNVWMALTGMIEARSQDHLNWSILLEAEKEGMAKRTARGSSVRLRIGEKEISRNRLAKSIGLCSSVEYPRDGPEIALSSCLFSEFEELFEIAEKARTKRKEIFQRISDELDAVSYTHLTLPTN